MAKIPAADGTRWFINMMIGFQLLVIGGFIFGLWLLVQDFRFSQNAVQTEAQIVDVKFSLNSGLKPYSNGSLNVYPVFSFIDQNGDPQTVTPIVAMNGQYKIGEIMQILFDPNNPGKRVQLVGWRFFTGIGGIILLVTAPMALLFIWGNFRQNSSANKKRHERNRKARERRAKLRAEKLAAKDKET